MASLKKTFSISKLYSDLEKYEANLTNIKDSRLKKQTSASSFYERPSSTHKKYESRQSFTYQNLARFQKPRQQIGSRDHHPRATYEKSRYQEKDSFMFNDEKEKQFHKNFDELENNKTSVLRQSHLAISHIGKQNKQSKVNFNKNDQVYFLNECNKLYQLNSKSNQKTLTAEEEANSVKVLLKEINKRDNVYELVTKRLGAENIEKKLDKLFTEYERMAKIIKEFKKMSKLNIDDDQQLYQFLIGNEDEEQGEEQKRSAQENSFQKREEEQQSL